MRCDVEHETAKREYPNIDVYGAAQQRFCFLLIIRSIKYHQIHQSCDQKKNHQKRA